jgi:hypothetical protein
MKEQRVIQLLLKRAASGSVRWRLCESRADGVCCGAS